MPAASVCVPALGALAPHTAKTAMQEVLEGIATSHGGSSPGVSSRKILDANSCFYAIYIAGCIVCTQHGVTLENRTTGVPARITTGHRTA